MCMESISILPSKNEIAPANPIHCAIMIKCLMRINWANELREKGIYPYFHALETRQDTEVIMEGKRRIMLGSNNYLGLTTCPEVQAAGLKALEQPGQRTQMDAFSYPSSDAAFDAACAALRELL